MASLVLCVCLNRVPASAADHTVSLKLSYVVSRINPPSGAANGMMLLLFTNKSSASVLIPTSVVLSGPTERTSTGVHIESSRFLSTPPGDFATVKYIWTDSTGATCLERTIDFTGTIEEIAGQSTTTVAVPLDVPNAAGKYELAVCFDNERLKQGFMTHGSVDPDESKFRFVQLQDKELISVTTKNK